MFAEQYPLWVLTSACCLLWATVILLLRRVRETDSPMAWKFLGLAVGVLAMQRSYELYLQISGVNPPELNVLNELLGLAVAGLLLGGTIMLSPIMKILQRNKELLEVIDERNLVICQFHERIAGTLRQVQMALEVGKPTNHTLEQVSEMSKMLHVFLEDLKAGVLLGNKFEVALKTLVEDLSKEGTFPISVHVDSLIEDSLSYDQGAELLHIVREAVRNSVQYSQAKKGKVSVNVSDTLVILEISDNGKGFEFDLVGAQGHGLGHMALRAKEIGARLKVQSQPNKGTTILVELPREKSSDNSNASALPGEFSHEASQKATVS